MTRLRYEVDPRSAELGGGWRLRLLENDVEVGGGVFPLSEYATADNAEEVANCAYEDALIEAEAWMHSRRAATTAADTPHMLTASGIDYAPGALRVKDVRIDDIAHALALICRFGGHCAQHYSVAQHSLLVVDILSEMQAPPEAVLCGLLHDAHEAYVGDVPTPIKAQLGSTWADLEYQAREAVLDAFGVRDAMNDWCDLVSHADRVALATERRDLMHFNPDRNAPWTILEGVEPFHERIDTSWWSPQWWAGAFLNRFEALSSAPETPQLADSRATAHWKSPSRQTDTQTKEPPCAF